MSILRPNVTAANPATTPAANPAAPKSTKIKVAIFGFIYTVAPIPVSPECGTLAFEMRKLATSNTYNVVRDNHGETLCDCPDFEMRKAGTGQACKHGAKLI
jgi:hypothetical protein